MSASWPASDYAILLAAIGGLVASCFAGARLSNCVTVSVCSERGWLYIERRIPPSQSPASPLASVPRTSSQSELDAGLVMV
jgi:hypothetical protein